MPAESVSAEPSPPDTWTLGPADRSQPAGRILPLVLAEQLEEFRRHEAGARAGDDVEQLHQHRVALRRARSLMAAGATVLPAEELELLRALSAQYATLTSSVRDLDVLAEQLPDRVLRAPERLRGGEAALARAVAARRDLHQADLVASMDGELYTTLLRRWHAMGSVYRVGGSEPGPDARRSSGEVVDRLLLDAFDAVRRAGRRARRSEHLEDWHRLRKRVKRLRYLVASFAPMYPEGSFDRLSKRLSKLQDGFGHLQDHAAQLDLLVEVGADAEGRGALLAGSLVTLVDSDTAEVLEQCRSAWERFRRAKLQRSLRDALEAAQEAAQAARAQS